MRRSVGLVFGTVMLLAACSGGDDASQSDSALDDAAATEIPAIEGDGSQAAPIGPIDFGDFPIAAPPVEGSTQELNADGLWSHTVTFPSQQFGDVMAFYDQWIAEQSQEYQRVEAETGGVVYSATIENKLHQITIGAPIEGDPVTFVTLGVGNL